MADHQNTSTRISIHSLKNILGNQQQISLFSEHDKEFASEFGIELFNSIDRFGINLTDIQSRVLEGILRGFSETEYKGNISPKLKEDISKEKFSGKIPNAYKYIKEIPRLKATQSQLLDLAGINKNSIASKTRALEALNDLATVQFCFYYERLAFFENSLPEKDATGKWKKEHVSAVDTLFTIKAISESNGIISYYEITPSSIFLDQIDGFFILIPHKWREEVKSLVGNKKASAYTFRFLLFLRYQYELKRRSTSNQNWQLKWSPQEIAIAIKMPESVYKRKIDRMDSILSDVYSVAKRLGYLKNFERLGYVDILTFNEQKYSFNQPRLTQNDIDNFSLKDTNVNKLFDLFVNSRKILDPHYVIHEQEKKMYYEAISELLQERTQEDISQLITWASKEKYWASRLSSPIKLKIHFSEAWIAHKLSKTELKEDRVKENKKFANEKLKAIDERCMRNSKFDGSRLTLLSKGVEFSMGSHCTIIDYEEKEFMNRLRETLKRYGFLDVEI